MSQDLRPDPEPKLPAIPDTADQLIGRIDHAKSRQKSTEQVEAQIYRIARKLMERADSIEPSYDTSGNIAGGVIRSETPSGSDRYFTTIVKPTDEGYIPRDLSIEIGKNKRTTTIGWRAKPSKNMWTSPVDKGGRSLKVGLEHGGILRKSKVTSTAKKKNYDVSPADDKTFSQAARALGEIRGALSDKVALDSTQEAINNLPEYSGPTK